MALRNTSLMVSMALACVPVLAQQGAENPPPAMAQLPAVDVKASRSDNGVGTSDAASQGSVPATLLENRPLARPAEVLETVPGLVVTQHSGDGKANQYFLRGFNLDHGTDFSTTVDGLPVNMPTHVHGQGYSDLNFLIPELVEFIDYRKGPYFASTGDFSAAGSASISYRQKLDAPFLQTTLGNNGYRRLVGADSTTLSSGATLLSAIELMGNDGPWTVKEGLHRSNALFKLSDGTQASGWYGALALYDASWNATDQVPERLIASGTFQGRPFGKFDAIDATDGGETSRTSLSGQWHDTDRFGATQVSAYLLHYTLKLFSNFTYFLNRPSTGDQFLQQEARDVFGFSSSRSVAHAVGSYQALTEFGLLARHDSIHAGLFDTQNRVTMATTRVDDVRETQLGIYGQTGIEWLPKLRTLLGVRADSLNVDVNSALQPLNSGNASSAITSPKASVILGPWNKTEFFANYGAGFHSNDARGMTSRVDPRTSSALQPVAGLVKAQGAELGLRSEAIVGLQSSLALWQLDFDSELVYSGDAGTTSPKGPSRRYGVEWNNHWVASPGLLLDFDWAWTHARFNNAYTDGITTGSYVPNSVDEVATGTITFKNWAPWTISFTERYIGPGALTADNSVRSNPSLLSNLRIMRSLKGKSSLALDVLNLFDRQYNDIEYYYSTQLAGEATPVNGKVVHPGEGRAFRLTLRLEL